MNPLPVLSNEVLLQMVPAVGAERPSGNVSSAYKQIQTLDVVNILRDQGWMPVKARSMAVRKAERLDFCKHEIRFQREGDTMLAVGEEALQLILTNSHDAGSAYCIMLGVFRLICGNGMVVRSGSFQDIRIRHVGFDSQDIIRASSQIGEHGRSVADNINAMKAIDLSPDEQGVFAKSAACLLFDNDTIEKTDIVFEHDRLNWARRNEDRGCSLWKTFNRVQENVVKGHMKYFRKDDQRGRYLAAGRDGGRFSKMKTQQVKSIDRDIKLNQSLWMLAEEMLKLKGQ
jgi:hypothetical protein